MDKTEAIEMSQKTITCTYCGGSGSMWDLLCGWDLCPKCTDKEQKACMYCGSPFYGEPWDEQCGCTPIPQSEDEKLIDEELIIGPSIKTRVSGYKTLTIGDLQNLSNEAIEADKIPEYWLTNDLST